MHTTNKYLSQCWFQVSWSLSFAAYTIFLTISYVTPYTDSFVSSLHMDLSTNKKLAVTLK